MKVSKFPACILTTMVLGAIFPIGAQEPSDAPLQSQPRHTTTVPRLVRFNGVVKDFAFSIPNESVSLTFGIYELPQGGAPLWTETQNVQLDEQGSYSVLLGAHSGVGLPLDLFSSGKALWLGVKTELPGLGEQSRVLLVAVPYALKALDAETLGGKPASAFATVIPGEGSQALNEALSNEAGLRQGQNSIAVATIGGSGSTNFIPIWNSSSTLGNSTIFQAAGKVGVGTTSPAATLDLRGRNGSAGGSAPAVLKVTGGVGGNISTEGSAGNGGGFQLTSGSGGSFVGIPTQRGGAGAAILVTGGTGGSCTAASVRCFGVPGKGGSITLQPGIGGFSSFNGNVLLAPSSGSVGIGETNPGSTLEVKAGGTTLADSWTTRSSLRWKTNIQPLENALERVGRLRAVSYVLKTNGRHEIGVIAEEVGQVLPEVVSYEPNGADAQGVDYGRLAALLIEAVKEQQTEITELKAQIQALKPPLGVPAEPMKIHP